MTLTSAGAPGSANVGDYAINGSGAAGSGLANYTITYVAGTMTVDPASLVITANDQTKTYGTAFTFDGTEFTTSTLFNGDTVDSIDLASAGAIDRANVGDYAITGSGAEGSGLSNYVITYEGGTMTVDPASLVITANDQTKTEGNLFTFNGTEFTSSGLFDFDSIDRVDLASEGAPANASADGSPYVVTADNAQGDGLSNYTITYVAGEMTVTPGSTPPVIVDNIPRPPVTPEPGLPNPVDTITIDIGTPGSPNVIDTSGPRVVNNPGSTPTETFAKVDDAASLLEIAAESCSQSDADVTRYLACLSDALDDFANKLDEISTDLPPGMENVAQIVRDARRNIDSARARAETRLATATTQAERDDIRRDAINEARGAIATASAQIREAITLVRADDPELARVQTATINRVAEAVDTVGIQMSRAVGL